jgi:L-lactate dehydrogenase (cytochrome)/(S)-mandelate dehydrogenase
MSQSDRTIEKIHSVAQMRTLARRTLPRPIFDFADGGAEDELTLNANEDAFSRYSLVSRPIGTEAECDLSIDLFGQSIPMPLVIGPTGLSGLFHAQGEQLAARAAQAAGIPFCLSHGSVCTLEELAGTGVAPRWMQVFIYRDRGFTREHIARAADAGYDALVVTVDNQLVGQRERDLRNGFTIPPRFSIPDTLAMITKLPWLLRMRKQLSTIKFGNYERYEESASLQGMAAIMPTLLDPQLHWDDIKAIRKQWSGPFILKGVLHPDDAAIAIDCGVDAIIVSNHGGRQLDGAVSSLLALPAIAKVVDGRIPVLLDGGIRRGRHVLTALALGATACLIARPQLWGLAVGGQSGVEQVLTIYRRELSRAMGLCGVNRIADINRDLLFRDNGI